MSITAQQQGGQAPGYERKVAQQFDPGRPAPAAAHLSQLEALTAALLVADGPESIAAAAAAAARDALGAQACGVRVLNSADATLEELHSSGLTPATQERFRRLPLAATNPVAAAVRTGAPLFFPSLAELVGEYPQFAATMAALGLQAVAALPLGLHGQLLGSFAVAFAEPRPFDKESRALLATLAGQCALALNRAQLAAAASAAARARDRFIAVAAHDLRTPLTVLLGQAQVLERRLENEGASEQFTRAAQMIVQQSTRLSRMISALLDLCRIDDRQLVLAREAVELGALIERVAAELQASTRRHQISVTGEPGPHVVLGDPMRLEQIFHNLISNAVRYSPAGGPVAITLARHEREICAEVSDWGLGIPSHAVPRLFERFYSGPSPDGRTGGQGLGLYVVRELVTLHGGSVSATSVEGEGSTFTVCLPAHSASGAPEGASGRAAHHRATDGAGR